MTPEERRARDRQFRRESWKLYAILSAAPLIVVGYFAFRVWLAVWAPCRYIEWLSAYDAPMRCVPGGTR